MVLSIEFIIGLFLSFALGFGIKWLLDRRDESEPIRKDQPDRSETKHTPTKAEELYELAEEMKDFFQSTAHPKDLLDSDDFWRGVKLLAGEAFSNGDLLEYYAGDNPLIGCMAIEALKGRPEDAKVTEQLIARIGKSYLWPIFFVLRALRDSGKRPVIGEVLLQAQEWWVEDRLINQMIDSFIEDRIAGGEQPTLENLTEKSEKQMGYALDFVEKLNPDHVQPLKDQLTQKKETLLDKGYLKSVGSLWGIEKKPDFIREHPALIEAKDQIEKNLLESHPRSILLTGETGVGKKTLIKWLARRFKELNWHIFEAGATEIMAGQTFIGELEMRIQKLVKHLNRKRAVIWFIPNIHELFYAGRHRFNPAGVLDMVMPHIESGDMLVIGETDPTTLEMLSRENRRIKTNFEIIHLKPLDDTQTLQLACDWAEHQKLPHGRPLITENTIKEAWFLSRQFLSHMSPPGVLLDFIKLTRRTLMTGSQTQLTLTIDDFYLTLSHLTGLPRAILDDRQGLDLSELHNLFQKKVKGQSEAVKCLIERVAMIKAGLTDSTRPYGVFLFAGPTGTGKTEIAKTLSEFLFGSADRMIRLDMSEFKNRDSEDRILGTATREQGSSSLVHQIRKQPFSVILLDEFEKAHSNIWDLFLQVFDDGRLTDRHGNIADFRHAIIILTSNLGSTIQPGDSIGFNPNSSMFSFSSVEKAIGNTFRREFINRLDRVVIFHPLSWSVMREILYKELNQVLERRGLRNREWAVEWEDSAIEFLLSKGFTPDLGARPVKRAIEQYLLSPLAVTIVEHQFPTGDQFLFVRSDGHKINVEFIDPDKPGVPDHGAEALNEESQEDTGIFPLKQMILNPKGTPEELEYLKKRFKKTEQRTASDEWRTDKQSLLRDMSEDGFWNSADRFRKLGDVEYMDRIESGLQTAGSLLNRLAGKNTRTRTSYSKKLVLRLAQQLYLLQKACRTFTQGLPRDAFLVIEAVPAASPDEDTIRGFSQDLSRMYQKWADRRRMQIRVLEEISGQEDDAYRCVMAVSGFGSYAILEPETGLHILEEPKDSHSFIRHNTRVRVFPQDDQPEPDPENLLNRARDIITQAGDQSLTVVRRYRKLPSPLVRDSIRNWRSGRLDRVLDGDFDLLG